MSGRIVPRSLQSAWSPRGSSGARISPPTRRSHTGCARPGRRLRPEACLARRVIAPCGSTPATPTLEGADREACPAPLWPHSNLAGDENGLVASTTNITRAFKSLAPLLEISIGKPGARPGIDSPALMCATPLGVFWLSSPLST